MPTRRTPSRFEPSLLALALGAALALTSLSSAARVVRIVVDDRQPLAAGPGQTIAYEQISGRAFGELDPRASANAIIQDIQLGKDADGKVRYTASFVITKPVDLAQASGLTAYAKPLC